MGQHSETRRGLRKWDPFFNDPAEINLVGTDYNLPRQATLKTIREVAEMVRGIREGGPEFEICVEAHAKFNVGTAVRIAKAIEPYAPMFFEEPVPAENVDAMRKCSARPACRLRRASG
jgi:L-alanine-DL-glutamate epimerase-like enolase superfamily enzyme